jgi:tetratricopeptide (TPR) repeat protein
VSKLRDLKTAAEDMKELVRILPNRGLYRVNLAAYAAYSGDSQTAEYVSLNARGLSPWAPQVLAFAQTLQGRVEEAAQSYRELGKSTVGPSFAASGLADLAVYQGRYAEAVQLVRQAAEADLAANEPDRAAFKLVAVGFTELLRQNKAAAIAAAEEALAKSGSISVRFIAARVLIEAGLAAAAESIAAGLANDSELEAQAHGGILAGLIALARGDEQSAIERLVEANGRLDTWIGHFDLGRAYLAASAYRQTESEFDLCISRRGEALALFLDEEPTFGLFPPVYYYQGLAREGLKSERSAESYRAYLDIRGQSTEDALVEEIRRRAPAR